MPNNGFTHERGGRGQSNDWITPPYIIEALGPFTLDPCAHPTQPWDCAECSYSPPDDGLALPWFGYVWCNPPYGTDTAKWMARMAQHRNGIALVFARVETEAWQYHIWPTATSVLFPQGRIKFYLPDGTLPVDKNGRVAGPEAPSALVAWGEHADNKLRSAILTPYRSAEIFGTYIPLNQKIWVPALKS